MALEVPQEVRIAIHPAGQEGLLEPQMPPPCSQGLSPGVSWVQHQEPLGHP
jgi:hypothetical protein